MATAMPRRSLDHSPILDTSHQSPYGPRVVTLYYKGEPTFGHDTNPSNLYRTRRRAGENNRLTRKLLPEVDASKLESIHSIKVTFPGNRFCTINTNVTDGDWMPKHVLDAPTLAPGEWTTDYEFAFELIGLSLFFDSREEALRNCAEANKQVEIEPGAAWSRGWNVVIELGHTDRHNGFVSGYSHGGAGVFSQSLDTPFLVVVPTAEEIARFTKGGAA